jgi:DnaJ-class molecular chaperone
MNSVEAKQILGLVGNYSQDDLKKNYHKLAKKYHPDKCKGPEQAEFIKVQSAYEYLKDDKNNLPLKDFDFGKIFSMFSNFKKKDFNEVLSVTVSEFFTGVVKTVKKRKICNCFENLCLSCAGCGFNLKTMEACPECDSGSIPRCNCGFDEIEVTIPRFFNLNLKINGYSLKLDSPGYTYRSGKIYHSFDISLKDSLVGFVKTYKDPFGDSHVIRVKTVVKPNDGYLIKTNWGNVILSFNIIYPQKLSKEVKMKLNALDF